ncbi:hypothetical protein V1507DRAFT_468301 [Lipomyces tetrasporus]
MDRMITRRNRPHYFVLNDGIDEEAPPEDQLDSSQLHISMDTLPDSDIFPSDSVSTLVSSVDIHAETSRHQPASRTFPR